MLQNFVIKDLMQINSSLKKALLLLETVFCKLANKQISSFSFFRVWQDWLPKVQCRMKAQASCLVPEVISIAWGWRDCAGHRATKLALENGLSVKYYHLSCRSPLINLEVRLPGPRVIQCVLVTSSFYLSTGGFPFTGRTRATGTRRPVT